MSRLTYENYGNRARNMACSTQVAGRYVIQREAERNILDDVCQKLQPEAECRFLDIGCGVGNILIPLSFKVKEMVGIDHPDCIKRLEKRCSLDNVTLIPGNFLELEFKPSTFDRILAYSVLHCLGEDELLPFIEMASSLLAKNGKLLLGDIPNISLKQRFLNSDQGKAFQKNWEEKCRACDKNETLPTDLLHDDDCVVFDDEKILGLVMHLRSLGYNAYILSQRHNLPFGYTREDILVERCG